MFTHKIAFIGNAPNIVHTIRQNLPPLWKLFPFSNLEGIRNLSFQAAILCNEPPMSNGLELLGKFRAAFPQVPVLLIGSAPKAYDIAEAFRLGANDYLFLPLLPEPLLNCLQKFEAAMDSVERASLWGRIRAFFSQPEKVEIGIVDQSIMVSAITEVEQPPRPDLQVSLMGQLSVVIKGKELPKLTGRKTKALLAFILNKYPKPIHRDVLIEQFWPDSHPDAARNCLNAHIHLLRRSFEKLATGLEVIVFEGESYGINPGLLVDRDVDIFVQHWEQGRRIEHNQGMKSAVDTYHKAFAFYRGDFLEDLPYEEWADWEREKLRETWLVILDRLSAHFLEKGKYPICLNLCQQALGRDPALEETHRRLMECYHRLGMREKAIRQFQKCRENLEQELKVAPGKATVSLYETILNG